MKKIRSLVIIAMLAALPVFLFAQPLPYQNGNGGNVGNTPVGAPIDGGLTILMLLGVGYGARKIYSIKKEKE
jgi:hypothetical protein